LSGLVDGLRPNERVAILLAVLGRVTLPAGDVELAGQIAVWDSCASLLWLASGCRPGAPYLSLHRKRTLPTPLVSREGPTADSCIAA
jgi:hypothetical protein